MLMFDYDINNNHETRDFDFKGMFRRRENSKKSKGFIQLSIRSFV